MDELNNVKDWLSNEVLPNIVKCGKLPQYTQNYEISSEDSYESFKVIDMSISAIGPAEAFMLTKCYRVKIDYSLENEEHSCILIAKRTPKIPPENYDAVNFETLFHNEISGYEIIIPTLLQFSKVDKRDRNFPKYYYSSVKDYEASLVLGDFNSDGWRMSESRVNLSLEHILLGVQHLGVFHGLCYALKTVDKNKFDSIIGLVKESRFAKPPPPQWTMMGTLSAQRFSQAVNKFCPEIPQDFVEKLQKILSDYFSYGKKRVQPIEPYATLCHGDYLRNNMAFAYDDENHPNLPTNVMMFDFQTLRYSSPMVDLCLFLSLSAGKNMRALYLEKILDGYFNKLSNTFTKHTGLEIPEYLSKSELSKEYVRYLPYSLSIAVFFLPVLYEPDDVMQEELLGDNIDLKLFAQFTLARGGEEVDAEIASLAKELYDLTVQESVDVFEGII